MSGFEVPNDQRSKIKDQRSKKALLFFRSFQAVNNRGLSLHFELYTGLPALHFAP
jgi:hypothetical protein